MTVSQECDRPRTGENESNVGDGGSEAAGGCLMQFSGESSVLLYYSGALICFLRAVSSPKVHFFFSSSHK